MAFILPGGDRLICAVAFRATGAARARRRQARKPKMNDLPPAVMERVLAIMTFTAVSEEYTSTSRPTVNGRAFAR